MQAIRKVAYLLFILLFVVKVPKSMQIAAYADDPHLPGERLAYQQQQGYVYVCDANCSRRDWDVGPVGYDFDFGGHTAYVPQVLANEWHPASQDQALQAGATAIDTFAHRSIGGCGAIQATKALPWPPFTVVPVENSHAQSYWLDASNQTGQNNITNAHRNAVANTIGQLALRGDMEPICAKYFANCGNPTAASGLEPGTLIAIVDPVDSNNSIVTYQPGMSQNGTHAWELSGYPAATPWEYRQMLTHYYTGVYLSGSNPYYRWTWLNVTPDTRFQGTYNEDYYGPQATTPTIMYAGLLYSIPIHIQNTSVSIWDPQYNRVRLSYHWYDSTGTNIVIWDGLRTDINQTVREGWEVHLDAHVLAPPTPGTYVLKWDMVKEYVTWFSQQGNWPTQSVTVNVLPSHQVFLPAVMRNYP